MDSSVSPKDEMWFLRVCHHISNAVYLKWDFDCLFYALFNVLPTSLTCSAMLHNSQISRHRDRVVCDIFKGSAANYIHAHSPRIYEKGRQTSKSVIGSNKIHTDIPYRLHTSVQRRETNALSDTMLGDRSHHASRSGDKRVRSDGMIVGREMTQ